MADITGFDDEQRRLLEHVDARIKAVSAATLRALLEGYLPELAQLGFRVNCEADITLKWSEMSALIVPPKPSFQTDIPEAFRKGLD